MKRTARIWISAPDMLDGIFVETLEPLSPRETAFISIDNAWFHTQLECENWARLNGATEIEYL